MTSLRYLRNDRDLEADGMATKLEIALSLVAARSGVGLSQAEVARRAGWKPQFACRLESLDGRLPNLTTIARYARASGTEAGLLFSTPRDTGLWVVRGLTLHSSTRRRVFESYTDRTISTATSPVDAD